MGFFYVVNDIIHEKKRYIDVMFNSVPGLAQICDMYEYDHVYARLLAHTHTQLNHEGLVHITSLLERNHPLLHRVHYFQSIQTYLMSHFLHRINTLLHNFIMKSQARAK